MCFSRSSSNSSRSTGHEAAVSIETAGRTVVTLDSDPEAGCSPLDRVLLRVLEQSVADAHPLVPGRDQLLVDYNADGGLAAQRDVSRWVVVAGDEDAVVVEDIQDARSVPAPLGRECYLGKLEEQTAVCWRTWRDVESRGDCALLSSSSATLGRRVIRASPVAPALPVASGDLVLKARPKGRIPWRRL